jgi:hypothetical protein
MIAKTTAIIPPLPSTGMTESGGFIRQSRGEAVPRHPYKRAASALCTFVHRKNRHPGKDDPAF